MDRGTVIPKVVKVQVVIGFIAVSLTLIALILLPPLIQKRNDLSTEIDAKTLEVKVVEEQLETNKRELEAYETQLKVTRSQIQELQTSVREQRTAPIEALVKPRASYARVTTEEAAQYPGSEYRFDLFLEVPPAQRNEIVKVTYFMNHPSFADNSLINGDPQDRFRATYFGYGCLSNVIISITLQDGQEKKLDFNQCEAQELAGD